MKRDYSEMTVSEIKTILIAQKNVQDMMKIMPAMDDLKRQLRIVLEDGCKKKFIDLARPYFEMMTCDTDESLFRKAIKSVAEFDNSTKLWALKPSKRVD